MRVHLIAAGYVRSAARLLVWFNLPAAFIGAACAVLFNPAVSGDDLAVVTAIPLLLFTLAFRAIVIMSSQPQPTPEQGEKLKTVLRENRWLFVLMASVMALLWSLCSLVAVPVYALLGIEWAILYGLAWTGMLFGAGVLLFLVALFWLSPALPRTLLARVLGQFWHALGDPLSAMRSMMVSFLR